MIALLLAGALALDSAGASPPDSAEVPAPTLAVATPLHPPPLPRPVITLPEVRVDRDRELAEARRRLPTAFITELRTGVSGRAIETVNEVLAQSAGVHVLQYGGLGAFSTVSLRGAPSGQVSVFLDGVPLTSAAHGIVNLADLPFTAVEQVEVYRGQSPLDLGLGAGGGAVNLVTTGAPVHEARVAHGSYDTWEARATTGAAVGPVSILAHGGYQGSNGDFRYPDDNGTPLNNADDEVVTRVNNRFDAATGLVTVAVRPSRAWSLKLSEDFFHKAQGLPGLGAVPAYHPRLSFLRSLTHAELSGHGGGVLPGVRLRGSFQDERSRFRDRTGELLLGTHDTDDRFLGMNGSLDLDWKLPAGFGVDGSASLREERANPHDQADGFNDPPQSRRWTRGLAAALLARPFGDRVTLRLGTRRDFVTDRLRAVLVGGLVRRTDVSRTMNGPQAGVRAAGPWGFEARANWGKGERPPDFLELFGNRGNVLGNPLLVPEHTESWDAGGAWTGGAGGFRGALEWARFHSFSHDLILYVRNAQNSVKAMNVSVARIDGNEVTVRLAAPWGFAASGSYTWLDTEDLGPVAFWRHKRLPERPGHEGHARVDWRHPRVRLAADVQLMGDNYLDRFNRIRVDRRTLTGASITVDPFLTGVELVIEGKNLGDSHVADVDGFPLPGRSVFVACQFRLGPSAAASR